jgi:cellobiose-specific phosphotransferase system component IIC
MTLSPAPGKSAKWIRALFGGSLSTLVVGIALFLAFFVNSDLFRYVRTLEIPGAILTVLVALLFGYPLVSDAAASPSVSLPVISLTLAYWFLFGFGLTYFIKNNKMAIAWWLILVIIPGAVLQLLLHSLDSIFS